MKNILDCSIVLGSKSPRRAALLEKAGFNFRVLVKEVEEIYPEKLDVEKVAEYLAELKSSAFSEHLSADEIILTADTVVVINGNILGKPVNQEQAVEMLKTLSGSKHKVITGICLIYQGKKVVKSSKSQVTFEPFTEEEIMYYINFWKPYDKAGGYGIQDWLGMCKMNKIEGSYTNIMGLPMEMVYKEIHKLIQ